METIDSKHLAEIAGNFQISGRIGDIGKLASGNIHDTYFVSTSRSEEKGFILQKINRRVFASPEKIIENHQVLSEHLKGKRKAIDKSRLPWKIPQIVKTHTQDAFIVDKRGDFWRATEYIGNSKTYVCPSDPEIVYHVGRSLGQFHLLTSTLDITRLHRVPDGFHVTSRYYKIFLSRQKAAKNRQDEKPFHFCLTVIQAMGPHVDTLERAQAENRLRIGTIHGDPKISNILFHAQKKIPVGIVDLDTVQPGPVLYDIGDCARSCCNPLGEDTTDFDSVRFDLLLFQKLMEGYLEQVSALFTRYDYRYLFDSLRLIAFELGLRFFTDYLSGDRYFGAAYRNHNLNRALVQFLLVRSMEKQKETICGIVDRIRKRL